MSHKQGVLENIPTVRSKNFFYITYSSTPPPLHFGKSLKIVNSREIQELF